MTDGTAEPGFELVLDNRKLIVAFAILIAICGCFFVVGFIEGKRQGFQEGSQTAAESSTKAGPDALQVQASKPAGVDTDTKTLKEDSEEQQLDWYKNLNRRESQPGIVPPATTSGAAAKVIETAPQAKPATSPKTQANAAASAPVTYSVQVGAFRQLGQSEIRAQTLRSKGYDCRIESPQTPGQLYLLKVGKFKTRAEAVAMQRRLKRSGFTSAFIKTN